MRTEDVLTSEAVEFLTDLDREFRDRRAELLARRAERFERLAGGELPEFLPETAGAREGDWAIAPFPDEIADRRVEITGPVDRKMVINALNSGAKVFMADFEDANSPTWENCIQGQRNLTEALDRTISPRVRSRCRPPPRVPMQRLPTCWRRPANSTRRRVWCRSPGAASS